MDFHNCPVEIKIIILYNKNILNRQDVIDNAPRKATGIYQTRNVRTSKILHRPYHLNGRYFCLKFRH